MTFLGYRTLRRELCLLANLLYRISNHAWRSHVVFLAEDDQGGLDRLEETN